MGIKSWLISKLQTTGNGAKAELYTPDNILARQLSYMLGLTQGTPAFNYDLRKFIQDGYVRNPHIHKVVNRIFEPAKTAPWHTYILKDKKMAARYKGFAKEGRMDEAELFHNKAFELVTGDPMTNMFENRANENQTWNDFLESSLGYYLLTGNDFIYGLAPVGFKYFTKIYSLPPQITEIIPSDDYMQPIKGYKLFLTPQTLKQFTPEEIAHRKRFNPSFDYTGNTNDYYYGLSPLAPLSRVYNRSNQSLDASLALLTNGIPAGIISSESELPMKPDEVKRLEDSLYKKFGGGKNKGKVMFSNGKVKWEEIGMKSWEMELLEADKADLKSIATLYNVPLALVSDESSTFNNVSEANKSLWTNAIVPQLTSLRDTFNNFVTKRYNEVTGKEYWCDFDLKAIPALQEDKGAKSDMLLKQMANGLWTGNEVRFMLDHDTDESNELLNQRVLSTSLKYSDVEKIPERFKTFISVINSLSPQVANNVIGAMTENELRELVAVGILKEGELTINQLIATRGQGVDPNANQNGNETTA